MLIDFTVGNYGPFRDDIALSLRATTDKDHTDNLVRIDDTKRDLLSSILIFGPNAAGKTYIMKALATLASIVRTRDTDGISPRLYTPCRVSKENRESPIRFKIRLSVDSIDYEYRVEFKDTTIAYESLYHSPNGRMAKVFERTGPDKFVKAKKKIVRTVRSNVTYLAMASIHGDDVCTKVRDAITNDFVFVDTDLQRLVQRACIYIADDPKKKERLVDAMKIVDLSITDITVGALQQNDDTSASLNISLKHDFADIEECTLPMEIESKGTSYMFGILSLMIDALENGKVLLVDDLGTYLHPMVTHWIVKQFSGENNPHGAQLIATTHDVGLMDIKELLRRDQIWFVDKDRSDGASELYSLSDFDGVRKDMDILRRYLDGRFDAIPSIRHRKLL